MAVNLRNVDKKSYSEDDFVKSDLIEGKRTWTLEDKLSSERFDKDYALELNANEMNYKFVQTTGLSRPAIVKENHESLGLKIPSSDFEINQVKQAVGGRRVLDVVDVLSQKELSMTMKEFCDYYETTPRLTLLNVLSLEFSQTKLESFVESPTIVRQLDWVATAWPHYLKQMQREQTNNVELMKYPKVQKYCLMSVATCWTDFHIDFGGTSVWYHVVRGEKTFFLIPPTPENLSTFESWTLSRRQDDIFFGDLAECQRITLKPGWTFFLPCGWIHAVYTPKDSLVFGGNFLHSFQIPMQLKVMELEGRTHVPSKFRYPFLQEMYWYVAARYLYILTGKQFLRPPNYNDISELVRKMDATHAGKSFRVKTATPAFSEKNLPIQLTELEYNGLRQLSDWLSKSIVAIPPSKRSVPTRIINPDELLLEFSSEIDNHAVDDWDQALNGKPLLRGFEHVSFPISKPLKNTQERAPAVKKARISPSASPEIQDTTETADLDSKPETSERVNTSTEKLPTEPV